MKMIFISQKIVFFIFILALSTQQVLANVIVPPASEVLLTLVSSSFAVFLIFSLLIGLLFQRRFILTWHAIAIFMVTIVVGLLVEGGGLQKIIVAFIFPAILYALFLSIVAFIGSVIGMHIPFFRNIQETLERLAKKTRFFAVCISYAVLFFPAAYMANNYWPYSIDLVLVGGVAAIILICFLVRKMYHAALQLPKQKVKYAKRDWIYFIIMVLLFSWISSNFVRLLF